MYIGAQRTGATQDTQSKVRKAKRATDLFRGIRPLLKSVEWARDHSCPLQAREAGGTLTGHCHHHVDSEFLWSGVGTKE